MVPPTVQPILELARKAFREKDWPEAARRTREVLELDPGNAAARELLRELEAVAPGDETRTMTLPLAAGDPDPFEKAGKWRIPMPLPDDTPEPVSDDGEFTRMFGLNAGAAPAADIEEPKSEPGEFTGMFPAPDVPSTILAEQPAHDEAPGELTTIFQTEFTGMFPAPSVSSAAPAPDATDFPKVFPSPHPIQPPRAGPGDYDKDFGASDTPTFHPQGTATQFVDAGGVFPQDTPAPAIFGDGSYTQLIEQPSLAARRPSNEPTPPPNGNARRKPVAGLFLVLAVLLLLAVALSLYFVTER